LLPRPPSARTQMGFVSIVDYLFRDRGVNVSV